MIKYICDKCGAEIINETIYAVPIYAVDGLGCKLMITHSKHLCKKCAEKFDVVRDRLQDEKDFFDMSDEDLELMRYDFKVGDRVITSDGEVGIIKSICDCEKCKERGFYEPQVTTIIGDCGIYITDTDKNNGFNSFYKIGKYRFGNLDVGRVECNIDYNKNRIVELQKEITTYNAQIAIVDNIEDDVAVDTLVKMYESRRR